ncbi:GlxA family transcriptional regulator [Phyllobacterium endophyticum]|uniref:AraC family transcriptional regulator n=2 Tax=Phyllobacterium endophyticum TaxID=1149773 RepID=A0A2P7AST4_9HYPH|nr:GlxA family transcriptional regulator [Phyllobacterium endophyticum]PSH57278.1 AraC family transcriptional regulator [Phyllobacterium endophyticum]TYR39739.1 GlxA family transcriptional regulator [Phyllobacterium endophyticum]
MLKPARRVEIVTYDEAQLLDICGPLQVFATANEFVAKTGGPEPYEYCVVSRGRSIKTAGLEITTALLPDPGTSLDTLIVVGGNGFPDSCRDRDFLKWLQERAAHARRVTSVCTGAFILAEAGLLDARVATTHWQFCQEFSTRFPKVALQPDRIFTKDGNIWTSAGVTAGMDLSLALVEEDLGRKAALAIAQYLVMFLKRPGGQSQFSVLLSLQADSRFDRLHCWISQNLNRDLRLETLSDFAGMSTRSFSRHYKAATGRTPANAVEQIRVDAARRLIENGKSIPIVAAKCGFASKEIMRRAFIRGLGISPAAYAERFGRGSP